jgi:hypothetical protein
MVQMLVPSVPMTCFANRADACSPQKKTLKERTKKDVTTTAKELKKTKQKKN